MAASSTQRSVVAAFDRVVEQEGYSGRPRDPAPKELYHAPGVKMSHDGGRRTEGSADRGARSLTAARRARTTPHTLRCGFQRQIEASCLAHQYRVSFTHPHFSRLRSTPSAYFGTITPIRNGERGSRIRTSNNRIGYAPLSPYDVVIRTFRQSTFARISEVLLMLRRTWTAA